MIHKLPKIVPYVLLTFEKPRDGYWDGGLKSGGKFSPRPMTDGRVEWGSWGLNFYFRLKFGRTWKQAVSIAKRVIQKSCSVPCTIMGVKSGDQLG